MVKNRASTDQQSERRHSREIRELTRLQKQKQRPKAHGYLYYMLFIICIIYIADEITSQIGTQMQSVLSQELFAPVFGEDMALARMSALGTVSIIGSAFAMLYKPLSDRFGRKLFLVINTLGMGLGLLLIGITSNIPVYLIGTIVINFFTPHDMQAVYVLETAPAKHRAKLYSMVKAVATIGMMLIPLLRDTFMGDGTSGWRTVYLICAVFAAAAALIALLLVRESDVYLDERIAYLRMSDTEKAALKAKKDGGGAQGGLISAIKFLLNHRQLRWLLISYGFLLWASLITMYYESTMANGYAVQFVNQGMELNHALEAAAPFVTKALFLFPVGSATLQLMQGFLADKWGRKPAAIAMSACVIISYLLFFIGSNHDWPPYVVGFLCGAAVGSYWAAGDIIGAIMVSESTPTNLRSSVLTAFAICSTVFAGIGVIAGLVLLNLLGDSMVGYITLGIALPGLTIALILLCTKTHDTKNVDIGAVSGTEWD
ncbi:MAG: MFS transporter [Clostridia bacterium]